MFSTALKLFILIFSALLFFTKATDADFLDREIAEGNRLTVTTLDYSARATVDGASKNLLFRTSGLLPGGFDVASFRLRNDGLMSPQVAASIVFENASPLCDSLRATVYQDDTVIYKGLLRDLSFNSALDDSQNNDFILALSLTDNDIALKNLTCHFDLHLQTMENGQVKTGGLADSEIISNMITSGTW